MSPSNMPILRSYFATGFRSVSIHTPIRRFVQLRSHDTLDSASRLQQSVDQISLINSDHSRTKINRQLNVDDSINMVTPESGRKVNEPEGWQLPIQILPRRRRGVKLFSRRKEQPIRIVAPGPSIVKRCPEPVKKTIADFVSELDPTGARTQLLSLKNPEAIQPRDIVLVRTRDGDPFAGVVIRINRNAPNVSLLLRNTVLGTGIEREFKILSPNVTGIEIVQRAPKKPKQIRLYYMRQAKHDIGSVDNIVRQYLKVKSSATAGRIVLTSNKNQQQKSKKKKR
ncbi:hypothetical protein BT63DRAFT_461369 [Microthyrium microscopicum]|uniref:Ribosomal protein L19 n=1 Tax=Microthyrium microscopicum TaxID=703497 RepID=A0A6A6TVQ4_9PEZI|nr:hypothetical protein BT63DRAFT_461369 [Microthyrium microscopicum]